MSVAGMWNIACNIIGPKNEYFILLEATQWIIYIGACLKSIIAIIDFADQLLEKQN